MSRPFRRLDPGDLEGLILFRIDDHALAVGVALQEVVADEADSQSVVIYSEEDEPFQITRVETPAEWIKAEYKKIDDPSQIVPSVGKPGQTQYKLTITVGGPDAKIGPIADKINI